ncbi:MAG: hypothetical protein L6Q47_02425 [Ignavibacteriaceae bacterium]|nr:hypothetical protein [Ignavibacteriaceae bacterium]
MKTGCFLKGFIFATILLAAALYILMNKFDDYIAKPAKEYLVSAAKTEFLEQLDSITIEVPKDSLAALLNTAGETIVALPGFGNEKITVFADSLSRFFTDKVISQKEFNSLQYLLKEMKTNEK